MSMPTDVPIIDCMIGFPASDFSQYEFIRKQLNDPESRDGYDFPVEYMFKNVPKELYGTENPIDRPAAMPDHHRFRGARAVAEAKDGAELDGRTASKLTLAPSGNRLPLTEEEWKRRDELEAELETLRGRKSELSAQAYDRELERILIQLAKIYQAAEKRR